MVEKLPGRSNSRNIKSFDYSFGRTKVAKRRGTKSSGNILHYEKLSGNRVMRKRWE